MGDGDRLPPSAVGQCGSDDSLGSLTVNPGKTGLLPVGSRRQRAYRQACPSERTASSGNS